MSYKNYGYKQPPNVLIKYNISHDDYVFPVLGETFSIKDELKALGAHFTSGLNWFFTDEEIAKKCGRPYCKIAAKDIVRSTGVNKFSFIYPEELKAMVEPFQPKKEAEPVGSTDSEYVGAVGNEVSADVEVKKVFTFNGRYGVSYMFVMEDEDGNTFTWSTKSRTPEDYPEGSKFTVTGKVKEHREYNNIKQTVLNYCKMS